ncbi:MAG: MBL fold metallo-hydrolase [Candidatus Saccharibacteria bacterium]
MQVHVLASGSTGNAILFEFGDTRILVDAGISTRRIEHGLAEVGVKLGEVNAVLVTHEHTDHIKGLEVMARRHRLPIYARPAAWEAIEFSGQLPADCINELSDILNIGAVRIEPFSISHDAADPVGFCFYYKNRKCVLATDLGIVTETVEEALSLADLAVFESNHDIKMLDTGPYPHFLKKRIRSNIGHLSNLDAARVLARINKKPGMRVFLAHLSQQNNHPEIAEKTVASFLESCGYAVGSDIHLHMTYHNRRTSLLK